MKQQYLFSALLATSTVSGLAAQPASAQVNQVTGVQINRSERGIEVILETADGAAPQTFETTYGETLAIDVANAQLRLPEEETFRSQNPAPGIELVTVTQQNPSSIRVTVTGTGSVPSAEVISNAQGLAFSVTSPSPVSETQPERPAPEAQPPGAQGEEPIELVVTATRTQEQEEELPRSTTVINRQQIEEQRNLTSNLQDILGQLVPGLATSTQSSSTFGQTLRGRDAQVLIDGVPQSTSRNAFRDLRTIAPAAIERVEVVRGSSAIYGNGATGGIINIITRKPTDEPLAITTVGVNGSLTNFDDSIGYELRQFVSGTEGKFDYVLNAEVTSTGSFFDAEGDRIPPDPNAQGGFADAETINFLGKIGVDFDEQQRLQLTFNRFDDRQYPDYATDPSVDEIPGRQKARTREGLSLDEPPGNKNTLLNLEYNNEDLFGSDVQAQLYYRDYLTRFFPFDGREFPSLGNLIYQSRVESEKFGGRLQIETPLSDQETARLLWGVDYFNEDTVQPVTTFDAETFDASGGLDFERTGERIWTPPLKLNSLGLFAQLSWDVSDRLLVRGGVRYENAGVSVDDFTTLANPDEVIQGGDLDFDATLFNIGTVYSLTDEVGVFANFAQGFSLADIGLVLRNAPPTFSVETLRPEPQKVNNYEIGIRGQWDAVEASLSTFYNQSELGTTFSAPNTVVRAPERVYGIEVAVDAQPSDNWQLGSSLTLLGGEIDQGDDGDYDPLDGFRIPPLKVTAYVENETSPGWRNRLQALFSGSRDVFDDSTAFGKRPVESYFIVDYISSIEIGSGTLQIGIENLFNNQYFPVVSQLQSNDSTYAAARGRRLSIKYSLEW
ncbi:MAG: TonB-dependent siderophore receptor [Cyanobacteria bacterium QS_4_48_99]|nr:MAG: TonB-dependent siderophore receptor [Cyanobacteria bacterium QS_4_48_99]